MQWKLPLRRVDEDTVLLRNEILGRAIEIPCEAVVRPTLGSRISSARAIRYVSTYKSCAIFANNRNIRNDAFILCLHFLAAHLCIP